MCRADAAPAARPALALLACWRTCRTADCGHLSGEHYRDRWGGGCLGGGAWCGCARFRRWAKPRPALRARWRTCRCGDPVEWHQHYRAGRDCSRPGCGCGRARRWGRPAGAETRARRGA